LNSGPKKPSLRAIRGGLRRTVNRQLRPPDSQPSGAVPSAKPFVDSNLRWFESQGLLQRRSPSSADGKAPTAETVRPVEPDHPRGDSPQVHPLGDDGRPARQHHRQHAQPEDAAMTATDARVETSLPPPCAQSRKS
jgi:hypothetical protein